MDIPSITRGRINRYCRITVIAISFFALSFRYVLLYFLNEQAGWIGSLFGAAADIAKVRAMFTLAFYPVLNTASTWNGNVDLHQISAMMAIAVFNEDETEFNLGLTRLASRIPKYFYLTTDTKPSASVWSNPALWVDGLTQETCRDNNHHAQFGLSGAIGAMELMGLQSSSGDMQGTCTNNVASTDVYDTWEIGYNHYHARKNIAMPNAWKMISEKVRFQLFANQASHFEIKVITLNGQVILQKRVNMDTQAHQTVSLGLERAQSGMYLIRVYDGSRCVVLPFAKQ